MANLPYNVATPLVADLLDYVPAVERMLVMVQGEVADRLVAPVEPGLRGRIGQGRLLGGGDAAGGGAIIGVRAQAQGRFGPGRPHPPGHARCRPAAGRPRALFKVVRAGFAQRRKMLRRALAVLVSRRPCRRRHGRPVEAEEYRSGSGGPGGILSRWPEPGA